MKTLLQKTLMVMSFFITIATTMQAQSYSGGSGTSGDPYHIANKTDLKYLSEHSGEWSKYFIQTADISFIASDFQSGGDFYNSGNGFISIGNSTTQFTGFYDGDYHVISGLTINTSAQFAAMFGYVASAVDSSISRLGLLNVTITSSNTFAAALVGYISAGTIKNSFSTGTVMTTSFYVGGLIGYLANGCTVTSSYSECLVLGNGADMGGVIGFMAAGSSASNCYATGAVGSASSNTVGGFTGVLAGTVANCYSTGLITGSINAYGFVGSLVGSGSTSNCFWNTNTSGTVIGGGGAGATGKTTAEMQTLSTFTDAGWDFTSIWKIEANSYPNLQQVASVTLATFAASEISTLSATLNGSVNSNGDTVAVRFLYGTSSGVYTDSVNAIPDTVTASTTTQVSASITGLNSGTTYYFVVAAENSSRYLTGGELSFTTHGETDSVSGNALLFPGSGSNYFSIPYSSSLNPSDNFTIEFWAWCAGGSTYRAPVASENSTGGSHGYYFYALPSNHWAAWMGIGSGWAIIEGDTVRDS
ncbi:MAG: fibronectin type III domain-containing protein, partial [Bacteroidota bacterium]